MTIQAPRISTPAMNDGITPLHIYRAHEPSSRSPRPMDRFAPVVTYHHRVGVMYNGERDQVEVYPSTQEGIDRKHMMAFGGKAKFIGYMLKQKRLWDFEHHEGGWVVYPHATTYLNGVKRGTDPLYLDSGDVLSAKPNKDGSFGVHVRVPIENENPLPSRDLAHVLMYKKAEPRAYKRVIAVLGSRINEDGSLPPVLEGRVAKAVDEFLKSYDRGVPAAMVFSGGPPRYKGTFPEGITEAKAMQKRALEMIVDERPEFKKFEDPLKHLMFLEERSLDAVGNAYFLRRLLESRENRKFFRNVQKVDVVLEEKFENRFGDAFEHIFHGMEFDLNYTHPPALKDRKSEEELRRLDGRELLMAETRAGNLDGIGRWLQANHGLYQGRPLAYFFLKPNWYKDRFQPWAQQVGDPWVKQKAVDTAQWVRRQGKAGLDRARPVLRGMGQKARQSIRNWRNRR